ncbi:hypothetical protein NL393_33790, partial [Klebsiella pneumoniae]|nr:hypothetical protein [Klebsiella pneumoniae]
EGDALMVMNCLQFTKSVKTSRVLFFNFRTEQIRIYRAAQQTVLNQQVYAKVRNAVLDKLGQGADDFITGLEI